MGEWIICGIAAAVVGLALVALVGYAMWHMAAQNKRQTTAMLAMAKTNSDLVKQRPMLIVDGGQPPEVGLEFKTKVFEGMAAPEQAPGASDADALMAGAAPVPPDKDDEYREIPVATGSTRT